MSSALAELWQTLPAYIVEFVGHQASHAVWEQHLVHSPVIAMQPNWQMLDANEAPELAVWGLQSITLHTAISEMGDEWPGAWPSTLPAAKAGIAHSNACFGEPLLHAQNIALYQIQSPLGLDWVAQCMFTSQGGLQHLSFIKMHDWKPLLEKYVEASPAVSEPAVSEPEVSEPEVSEPEVSEPESASQKSGQTSRWACVQRARWPLGKAGTRPFCPMGILCKSFLPTRISGWCSVKKASTSPPWA